MVGPFLKTQMITTGFSKRCIYATAIAACCEALYIVHRASTFFHLREVHPLSPSVHIVSCPITTIFCSNKLRKMA